MTIWQVKPGTIFAKCLATAMLIILTSLLKRYSTTTVTATMNQRTQRLSRMHRTRLRSSFVNVKTTLTQERPRTIRTLNLVIGITLTVLAQTQLAPMLTSMVHTMVVPLITMVTPLTIFEKRRQTGQ